MVYLTNTTAVPVHGTMTATSQVSGGSTPVRRRPIVVPPLDTAAVNPGAGLPAGSNASSYAFAGGGVAVTQVVSGPGGWSTAPCASTVGTQWIFPTGTTTDGNTVTLALFNPTTTAAMVDVSFLTTTGLLTPQPFQGVTVGAGQLVDEDVGTYAQGVTDMATVVTVVSGVLVSNEFERWGSRSSGGLALLLGSPQASPVWHFAQTTVVPRSTVVFQVADPSTSPVAVTFSAVSPTAAVVPHTIEVAGSSTAAFLPSDTPGWPRGVPVAVTVQATAPILVGRAVAAAPGAPAPGWGASSGVAESALHWLVPGPGVPGAPGIAGAAIRSLAVANPGPRPVRVTFSVLGAAQAASVVVVEPGELVALGGRQVAGLPTYEVSATTPVVVEEDSGPSGAPGVVSSSGMPFPAPG